MSAFLVIAGIVLVTLGGIGEWLPEAPSSIQTNTYSKGVSAFLLPNAIKFIFGGLALILVGVFVGSRH